MLIAFTYLPGFVSMVFRGMPTVWRGRHRLILGFQALAPEKVRLADNDGLMPRDESEGVFPEKVPFRERFL